MRAQILHSRMLNYKSIDYAQRLNIYSEIGHILSVEDWQLLQERNIYFNIVFSPGVVTPAEVDIPNGSQLINLDSNTLFKFEQRQRIAIFLHEIGHALNPNLTGREGEFIADDYAIARGYGQDIIESLNFGIEHYSLEFDKPITHERIQRITEILT
jgi:hypothetical protein